MRALCARASLASIDAALLSLSTTTAQCPRAAAPIPHYTRVRRSLSSGPACNAVRVGGAARVRLTCCRVALLSSAARGGVVDGLSCVYDSLVM